MTDFKAGQRVLMRPRYKNYKNQVVTLLFPNGERHWICEHQDKSRSSFHIRTFTECFTVRILPDGQAREVNPHKEIEVDPVIYESAESRCRTLPYRDYWIETNGGLTAEPKPATPGSQHYAFISADHFVLVQPVNK